MKRTELNQMVHIAKIVEQRTGVSVAEMHSQSRKRERVSARQSAMYLIRKTYSKISLKTIGEFFGGRDHSTVIHSCETVEDMMATNDEDFRWLKTAEFTKIIKGEDAPPQTDKLLETLYRLKSSLRSGMYRNAAAACLAQKAIDLRNFEQNREQVELALTAMKIDQMMNDDLN